MIYENETKINKSYLSYVKKLYQYWTYLVVISYILAHLKAFNFMFAFGIHEMIKYFVGYNILAKNSCVMCAIIYLKHVHDNDV